MNLLANTDPNRGSGFRVVPLAVIRPMDRFAYLTFRALALFRPIQTAASLASFDAKAIERPADNVISHAGQIPHAAAANQHDRVLLQRMSFARDIDGHFLAVAEPHA